MKKLLALIIACLISTSCTFSFERIDQKNYGETFASTKRNIDVLSKDNYILGDLKYLFILDLPFSLVTDIIIFPYDVYAAPEYKADREFWDRLFSTVVTTPPDYSELSANFSEYGAKVILENLGREYLKHHPDYALPFVKIAANNNAIERSGDILIRISSDSQLPKRTMIDICTLSVSDIEKYRSIITGYINNPSTPTSCLHKFVQVMPSDTLSNNRYQLILLRTIGSRLRDTKDPFDSSISYEADNKANQLHENMQVTGTVTSVDFSSGWITIETIENNCIATLFSNTKSIQVKDRVSGEFRDGGGSKAFNNTKNQPFNIYVPYTGDENEGTAKSLCM